MAAKKTSTKKTATKNPTTKKAANAKTATGKSNPKPAAKKTTPKTEKKMSALEAAAKVLTESKEPMRTKDLVDAMSAKGYWSSPGGKTPSATLFSAIMREINTKGDESRFQKMDRGLFTING